MHIGQCGEGPWARLMFGSGSLLHRPWNEVLASRGALVWADEKFPGGYF